MGFGMMMKNNGKRGGAALLMAGLLAAASGAGAQVPTAQETPRTIPGLVIATPTPMSSATPVPVPTAPVRGLPVPVASPAAAPAAGATDRSVERRAAPRTAEPSPTPTPASPAPASPSPIPTAVVPTPAASSTAVAPSAPALATSAAQPSGEGAGVWPWIALVVLALALAAWLVLRRRTPTERLAPPEPVAPDRPAPAPPIAAAGPRARIEVAFEPRRAGLNMLSAVVEGEAVVRNIGDAAAADIRIHATLLSAHGGQDADLTAAFAAPNGRPAAPPFGLAPGEERRVRTVTVLQRDALRSMEAGGRPMFVPLVAVDVRYVADASGMAARAGRAFVVGVERVDSAKLAPFWLDGPRRMQDQVAARAQGAVWE